MSAKKASAIAYGEGDIAPRLLVKARGREAERLVELAEDAGVTVVPEIPLAEALDALECGALVPVECWDILARILAFVMVEDVKR